jgi:transcriptional regulator with AAA-type ATPase domain
MLTADERTLAADIAALVYANPFLGERTAHERRILGDAYSEAPVYWSLEDADHDVNIEAIAARCAALVDAMRGRVSSEELPLYDDVVIYHLYERHREAILREGAGVWPAFHADALHYCGERLDAAHLFACFYQVRRAFHHIFRSIAGRSLPAARLRARVWQSIFTHDVRRYRRALYARMSDVATLITGPTGTGKELVARAIALSRYIPFDERRRRFAAEPDAGFFGLNLAALSPTLIESELFGHRKGSFTGAVADREGFLESCGALGTVFLDEIGEVEPAVQVKLLRVIQSRTFQRLGDTAPRAFGGKLIAATNRDLAGEIRDGRFREDFYYRLCADTIVTPTLHEQLAGSGDELAHLVRFICARLAGEDEAEALAGEVLRAIDPSHSWPGNFRELEQCVRSVMLRGSYVPAAVPPAALAARVVSGILAATFTADDLLRHYCTLLYAATRNYSQVAEKLGIDRRTVRAKVDEALLDDD